MDTEGDGMRRIGGWMGEARGARKMKGRGAGWRWLRAAGKEAGTGGAGLGLGGPVRWGPTKAACSVQRAGSGQWAVAGFPAGREDVLGDALAVLGGLEVNLLGAPGRALLEVPSGTPLAHWSARRQERAVEGPVGVSGVHDEIRPAPGLDTDRPAPGFP